MTNRERTKRCPIVYGSEIWAILHVTLQEKSELETEIRDGHLSVSK